MYTALVVARCIAVSGGTSYNLRSRSAFFVGAFMTTVSERDILTQARINALTSTSLPYFLSHREPGTSKECSSVHREEEGTTDSEILYHVAFGGVQKSLTDKHEICL